LTERIPGGDEGRAQGVVLGHERFELRARLADVQGERGFVVHDVIGFGKGLDEFRWEFHSCSFAEKLIQNFERCFIDAGMALFTGPCDIQRID
jgi:hypothetical protein